MSCNFKSTKLIWKSRKLIVANYVCQGAKLVQHNNKEAVFLWLLRIARSTHFVILSRTNRRNKITVQVNVLGRVISFIPNARIWWFYFYALHKTADKCTRMPAACVKLLFQSFYHLISSRCLKQPVATFLFSKMSGQEGQMPKRLGKLTLLV